MLFLARSVIALLLVFGFVSAAAASERDAVAISEAIRQRHMPHGVIVAPVFASPSGNRIVGYRRGGDAAIWTGHYLAAEAFRHRVTGSPEALERVWAALAGIRSLRRVTGTNLLARCLVPTDWAFASSITEEEAGHGIYTASLDGKSYYWVGNTSRDQYIGVFFGLSVAYDVVENSAVRAFVREEVTALLDFLLKNRWAVVMPDNKVSTVFWLRVDQQLALLQIGRRVNPERFEAVYREYAAKYSSAVSLPISFEVLDPYDSYFKFNLNAINLYNLVRLEQTRKYRKRYLKAYKILRATLKNHQNAHFNMIDRALIGPDRRRDAETKRLLEAWLKRPRRDDFVDVSAKYPVCGNRACSPLPVEDRVRTDFLWQRSPFQLSGGGDGRTEGAGIDYLLPYWMARYYEVL